MMAKNATKKTRQYKADFFVLTRKGDRDTDVFSAALAGASDHCEAVKLASDSDDRHQIRSISATGGRFKVYKGVFGRCRHGEKPVQGNDDGDEADVDLLPGHALVEKNHFIFYTKNNLLVYQRNISASHYTKFQRYVGEIARTTGVSLEPILTTDAYARLLEDNSVPRVIELSFQKPKDPSLYGDAWTKEAIQLINQAGGISARFRIGVGRSKQRLLDKMKGVAVRLAKGGLATVARVKIEGDEEPIDLIADRIVETIHVSIGEKGHPDPQDIYAQLANAVDKRGDDLKSFFGS